MYISKLLPSCSSVCMRTNLNLGGGGRVFGLKTWCQRRRFESNWTETCYIFLLLSFFLFTLESPEPESSKVESTKWVKYHFLVNYPFNLRVTVTFANSITPDFERRTVADVLCLCLDAFERHSLLYISPKKRSRTVNTWRLNLPVGGGK